MTEFNYCSRIEGIPILFDDRVPAGEIWPVLGVPTTASIGRLGYRTHSKEDFLRMAKEFGTDIAVS